MEVPNDIYALASRLSNLPEDLSIPLLSLSNLNQPIYDPCNFELFPAAEHDFAPLKRNRESRNKKVAPAATVSQAAPESEHPKEPVESKVEKVPERREEEAKMNQAPNSNALSPEPKIDGPVPDEPSKNHNPEEEVKEMDNLIEAEGLFGEDGGTESEQAAKNQQPAENHPEQKMAADTSPKGDAVKVQLPQQRPKNERRSNTTLNFAISIKDEKGDVVENTVPIQPPKEKSPTSTTSQLEPVIESEKEPDKSMGRDETKQPTEMQNVVEIAETDQKNTPEAKSQQNAMENAKNQPQPTEINKNSVPGPATLPAETPKPLNEPDQNPKELDEKAEEHPEKLVAAAPPENQDKEKAKVAGTPVVEPTVEKVTACAAVPIATKPDPQDPVAQFQNAFVQPQKSPHTRTTTIPSDRT